MDSTKINSISISNFTVFENNEISFSPGLNVFIGKNGTGKTHLLKILYSVLQNNHNPKVSSQSPKWALDTSILGNFHGVFNVGTLSNLIRNEKKKNSRIKISLSNNDFIDLKIDATNLLGIVESEHKNLPENLYIPPQEMLSWFNGFTALWEKREVDFDQTYYQLAKALELPLLKNGGESMNDIIEPLEKIIKAKIVSENGRFYLVYDWGRVEIQLVAEGFRKLATIIYLLANGSINNKTILFWDEPEVHFNPSVIEALVTLIKGLTNRGVQIFITTHDYLLSQRLSLIVEYENPEFPLKFFCFENEKNKGVNITEGHTLAEIDNNPILDEFAEYYDFERKKFKESLKK